MNPFKPLALDGQSERLSIPSVPENEVTYKATRSGGPGGQAVNKVSTHIQARWNIGSSYSFTEEEKSRIRTSAGQRVTGEDELLVTCSTTRSQLQNKQRALQLLNEIVRRALAPQKIRTATPPRDVVRRAQARRREEKRRRSDTIKQRWSLPEE